MVTWSPSSPDICIHALELELDGLDSGGNLKNSAAAVTKQIYIAYPRDKSHFRATMVHPRRRKGVPDDRELSSLRGG